MSENWTINTDALRQSISTALNMFVGPGRMSREELSRWTGIDTRTIKAHHRGETVPSVAALFSYFRVLPVAFAEHVLAQAGLGGVHRLEQTANANHVMAELGEGIAALGHAMADGHIDHRERPGVIRELREAAAAAEELAASLERGRT